VSVRGSASGIARDGTWECGVAGGTGRSGSGPARSSDAYVGAANGSATNGRSNASKLSRTRITIKDISDGRWTGDITLKGWRQ
ncbi:MAG: hypothetical protein MUC62_05320, partial [Candidatus Thermoplasmatota archaeon]|nr:hypothetical protein [Candidatus Thermoplasmatota archaeon]